MRTIRLPLPLKTGYVYRDMDGNQHPIRAFLFGLVILAVLGYGAYWGLSGALAQLAAVTSDLGKAIVAAGATVVVATISLVFGKIWEQKVKLQEEVRQRKLPVYEAHVRFMFETIFGSKDAKADAAASVDAVQPDVVAAFRTFTGQILVWGGPNVIKTWTTFRLHNWDGAEPLQGFLKFEAFIKALREELGNKNSNLADGDLLKLFVNDFDAYKVASISKAEQDHATSDEASP